MAKQTRAPAFISVIGPCSPDMSAPLQFGIYDPGCPPRLSPVSLWEKQWGAPITILSWYQAWGSAAAPCRPDLIETVLRQQLLPLITWEPWRLPETGAAGTDPAAQPDFALARLLAGAYDDYIRDWAGKLARIPGPVWLRPLHEMNGNWYPWAGSVNGNSPALFRRVWRHLRALFQTAGAANVLWVWCPYVLSVPETPANALERYFPGETDVDWLGLDGYNWGTTQPWSRWESFSEIFGGAYDRLVRLAPAKSIIIAEMGCAEAGGDKAGWIRDAFQQLTSRFAAVRAVVWFQINKECDWRLDSSPPALKAFQEQAGHFQARKTEGAPEGAPEGSV